MSIDLEIGESMDWKFGMVTRNIERISKRKYIIHDTSSGWVYADVNIKVLEKVITGELSLLDLEWK